MAPENTETMQKGHEASFGFIQGDSIFYGPPWLRSFRAHALDLKQTSNLNKANTDSQNDGSINCGKLAVQSESYGRPWQDYYLLSAVYPQILKELHSQSQPHEGWFYPAYYGQYFRAHWFPPMQMVPQSYPPEYNFQEFQYFVVIDFEATCDKDNNPHPQEIIEFPSVLVNSQTGQLEDCFQIYVRPTHNQLLTDFCKDLTGIQQSQVDKGVPLSEALLMHDKWLEQKGVKHANFAVVTWSNWDCQVMLESECRYKRIRKPPYFNRWINLKIPFGKMFNGARCNLKEAVELAGLTWEGRAHCGLDDAKNTARLLTHLMAGGFKFSITNTLLWQSADHPHAVQQQQPQPQVSSSAERGLTHPVPPYKWKSPYFTGIPYQPVQAATASPMNESQTCICYCGATSIKRIFQKPGPQKGKFYFACGAWTPNRGASCNFFEWDEHVKAG